MDSTASRSDEITPKIQLLDKSARVLHYLGLWPTSSGKGCYWYLIPRFTIAYELFEIFVIRCIHILYFWTEMKADELCVQMACVICAPLALIVIVHQMLYMHRAAALMTRLQLMQNRKQLQDKYQRHLLSKVKKITDNVAWIPWIAIVFLGVTNVILSPVLIQKKETLLGGYYPYDVKSAPYLHLTVIVQTLVSPVFLPAILVAGIFHISMLLHTKAQFRILNYMLRNIRAHSVAALRITLLKPLDKGVRDEKKVEEEGEGKTSTRDKKESVMRNKISSFSNFIRVKVLDALRMKIRNDQVENVRNEDSKLSSLSRRLQIVERSHDFLEETSKEFAIIKINEDDHEVADNDSNELISSLHGKSSRNPFPVNVSDSIKVVANRRAAQRIRDASALSVEMQLRLKNCVKMHQELLRICVEMDSIMSVFLMACVLGCLVPTVVAILYVTMVPLNKLTFLFEIALILTFSLLYALCLLADQITDQSVLVGEAAYCCYWFQASDSFKKTLRIVISNANRPFVFKACGFVPITVATFDRVVKKSYSYFTILNTIVRTKNHA